MVSIYKNLIKQNFERLKDYIKKNQIGAYRIFHSEYGDLRVAVDIYKDNAVIHVFEPVEPANLKEFEKMLAEIAGVRNFFYKNRTKDNFLLPQNPIEHKEITINEYGHQFLINLSDYLDTGLFLDHRETRKWIESKSKNKIVLNTFAYTGSFTVYAAKGGAKKTYSVDLSRTYCEWIKKNLALNNLPLEQNWVYKMDTLEFFKYAKRKGLVFDIIIIDPPTFSRNKAKSFSVQKDHPTLINSALELLSPDGFILFSTNRRDFELKESKISPCKIQDIENIPPDFEGEFPHLCFTFTLTA